MKIAFILVIFLVALIAITAWVGATDKSKASQRPSLDISDSDLNAIALNEINGTRAMISSLANRQEIIEGRREIEKIRHWANQQDPKLKNAYIGWLDYSERRAKEAEGRLADWERHENEASSFPNPRYAPDANGDHEDVFGEVDRSETSDASQLMMWALRSDVRYKWVELRAKSGSPNTLLVVRHTKSKP